MGGKQSLIHSTPFSLLAPPTLEEENLTECILSTWVFPKIEVPQNGW